MTPPTRRTVLSYLAGTFILGAVAGGAIGYGWGRRPMVHSFDRDEMRTRFCDRLVKDLGLSPEQKTQLDPILRQNMEEFEAVHRDHYGQIGELMKRGRERIASILTPQQRTKFEALEREREQRMTKEGPHGGGPPRAEGPQPRP